jgi:hypothetical protein
MVESNTSAIGRSSWVPDVVAGLDAVRVAVIHAGQVGTSEIFHLACMGARRTRSALAAENTHLLGCLL